ncbi:MAG: glycosyltransferase family 39 protein, partial [Flavobacteriaceae bacterium]|nr:glycosyltransferase family 39 protein [Flavobacteriaceae bacterium]
MNKIKNLIKTNPAISLVLGFQLYRFVFLPFMGLMPQDTYYYFYGENLALSYFDHPGMIGYILRLFTEIFGKTVFVIKFTDFVVTSLTLLSFYKLASYFLAKDNLNKALVLIGSTLFISILSFNSTPDVPLLLFWSISLIFLYKAIFEDAKIYWIWGGIAMGLAFDSKYTALFLQIGLLGFLILSKKHRRFLISPWLWVSLLISAIITFPVWWWNYQNGFASFVFQASDRTSEIFEFKISIKDFLGVIAHQIFLLLPVLFLVIVNLTFKHIKKLIIHFKLPSNKTLFLLAFFIPTFVGFFLISPFYWIKINWMMPSYITGIILASMYISKKMLKSQVIFSVLIHVLLTIQILFYIVPIKSDDTWFGWNKLAIEIEKIQENYQDTFIFSCDNYKTTAALRFYLGKNIYAKNIIGLT